jgi:folate-binding Fe-S cluster repair protein YgfZ
VQNLGRPPRKLVLLHFGGESDTLPPPGTPIELDGRSVGFSGTAVHHFELGPIGLGVIKRTVDEAASVLIAGHTAALDMG